LADLRGSQQNCIKFRMQLLRQNQESFSGLKHYRPYCFRGVASKVFGIHALAITSAPFGIVLLAASFMVSGPRVVVAQSGPSQLSQNTAKPEIPLAANNPDAQTAFQFLQQQMTIGTSLIGRPEPGLSRLSAAPDDICHLTCGYHAASSLNDVLDLEFSFAMADVAPNTLKWQIDKNNRGFISFGSTAGTAAFHGRFRSRKVQLLTPQQKPLSDWSNWSEWKKSDGVDCRSKPNQDDLRRALRAFALLAKACGAHDAPF
jgi:hypothetical protein